VTDEHPAEIGIVRRGRVIYRWKSTIRWPDPSPEVLEVVRRGERKLYEEYREKRRKRRAS
jgi:hypothetical protein